jgi:hypothetical protein
MPGVAVAHVVPVGVIVHELPTVNGVALHGSSLVGGGGTGEQVISIVPQFNALFAHPG